MARRSRRPTDRRFLAPLLLALLAGEAAAAPPATPDAAVRELQPILARGDYREAERKVDAALAAFGNQDSEAVWTLRIMRGWIYGRTARPTDALAILKPDPPPRYATTEAAFRRLIELTYLHRDHRDRAEPYAAQALALAAKHHPQRLAMAYFTAASFGDPSLKQQRLRESVRRASPVQIYAAAALALDLAQNERYAEAVQQGEAVLPRVRSAGNDNLLNQVLGNLAWAYRELGDFERATELFSQAAEVGRKMGNTHEQVKWLTNLGHLRRDARDFEGAHRYYAAALAAAPAEHATRGQILRSFGDLAVKNGRFDEARRLVAEARAFKSANKDTEADPDLRTDLIEARIHLLTGQRAAAEKALKRIVTGATVNDVKWEAQSDLASLYTRERRDGEAERTFRDLLAATFDVRADIKHPELRLSFSNLMRKTVDAYANFLVERRRVEEALDLTEASRAKTLEEALQVPAGRRLLDPRSIARERNAVILSYWLGLDRSLLWVVTPDREPIVYAIPAQSVIEREVNAYQRDLMGPRGSLALTAQRGERLYDMLVGRFVSVRPGSRVIVVPDGRLHVLNFETLIVPKPQRHYWIEDAIIVTASSLELVARADGRAAARQSLLVVGDPPRADPQFPPLAHAATEIDLVKRHFAKWAVLRKEKATPSAYRKAAPEQYDVLHFVAHGVANRLKPLDSAVILGSDGNEYKLYAREIVKTPLNAHLVTISSCHGAGTRTYGEGLVGLAWAFLGAGAENVIAALWEVDDRATPKLMDSLYEGIRAGRDPAVALREAKLKMVRSKGVWDRARYWAPFVLYSGS